MARRHRFAYVMFALSASAISSPAQAQTAPTPRQFVQHVLRRFAFSDSPEAVTAVLNEGLDVWLQQQLNWSAIDDSHSTLQPIPPLLPANNGTYVDYNIYERVVYQHNILTGRQLQAKLELHWLEHFSVSQTGVGDPGEMGGYEAAVRADSLGNFQTLLTDVSYQAAMLNWLNNNNNYGAMPNRNFGREVMQLFSIGTTQLNDDGTPKLDSAGHPKPTYTEADVRSVAQALTGYSVVFDYTNLNSLTRFTTQFVPGAHYTGPFHFLGQDRSVPNDSTAMAYVMGILANHPSAAPFQVLELLKRFAIENPAPAFVSDIVKVWRANANAPDQIGQVVAAIIHHPSFAAAYHSMPKQPLEKMFATFRQLPGMLEFNTNLSPGTSLQWDSSQENQELFYPHSVFSFFYPGHVETLTNAQSLVNQFWITAEFVDDTQPMTYVDSWIDMPTLRARIGATDGPAVADYLLDALVDGGSAHLRGQIRRFLATTPDDNQVRGAMWLILNSPDYAVN